LPDPDSKIFEQERSLKKWLRPPQLCDAHFCQSLASRGEQKPECRSGLRPES